MRWRRAGRDPEAGRRFGPTAAVFCIAVAAAAAGSCGDRADVIALECPELALSAAAAQPLDDIRVTGLPAALGDTLVAAVEADSLTGVTAVRRVEGDVSLVAPIHPAGTLEGGPVELRITDGAATCPAVAFTVEPLSPAPGTLADAVAALDGLIEAEIRSWGVSPEALRAADPDTLLPPLVPIRIALYLVDHPDNPNALTRAARSGPAEAGTSDVLIEALLARADLPGLVAARAEAAAGEPAPPRPPAPGPARTAVRPDHRSRVVDGAAVATFASYRPAAPVTASPAPSDAPDWFGEPDAEWLDFMMHRSMRGEIATTGEPAQIFSVLETTLAAGTLLPKTAGKFYGTLGVYYGTMYVIDVLASKLLPRRFTGIEITARPTAFEEDNPGPGMVEKIEVRASSEGLVLDATVAEEIIGRLTKMPRRLRRQLSEFNRAVVDQITDDVNSAVAESATQDSDVVDLSPQTFGPTDITDPRWRDIHFIGEAIEPRDAREGQVPYVPREVGTTTLRVATKWDRFGIADGQHIETEVTLRVDPIVVEMDPASDFVEPGQVVTITARPRNALASPFEWTASAGAEILDRNPVGDTGERARVRMPDPLPDAVVVTARSLADRTHLRSAPERAGNAVLRPRKLTIVPPRDCVETGGEVDFDVVGAPDGEVRWSATGGSIDGGGVFRPGGGRTATIRAASREDPSLSAELEVRVEAECPASCTFTASVNGSYLAHASLSSPELVRRTVNEAFAGDGSGAGPGLDALASFHHTRDTLRSIRLKKEYRRPEGRRPGELYGLQIELPPIPFGETGAFEAEGEVGWSYTVDGAMRHTGASTAEDHLTDDDGRLTVWLTRNDRRAVEGRFEGRMWAVNAHDQSTGEVVNAWYTVRGRFDAGDYLSGCGLVSPEEQQRNLIEDALSPDEPDPSKLDQLLKESGPGG